MWVIERPPAPGRVERCDSVYVRDGVCNPSLAFEPPAGRRHVEVTDTRTRRDRAHFVRDLVDGWHREAEKVVPVMDQLDTHPVASLYEAFAPEEAERVASRLEVHHTPKHGSRLNMSEIESSALARDLPERIGERAALGCGRNFPGSRCGRLFNRSSTCFEMPSSWARTGRNSTTPPSAKPTGG